MKILITGGTKGIGNALLNQLSAKDSVLVIARDINASKNQYRKKTNIDFLSVDLSRLDAYREITAYVSKKWGKIDVIVNNAATLSTVDISSVSQKELISVMTTNFISPIILVNSLSAYLAKNGLIVNVLSPAIFRNRKTVWLYVASKRALYSASEALHGSKPVLMYFPGIINTGIIKGKKSFLARQIEKDPSYTARKMHNLIKKRRTGIYFEPAARLLQIAGILGL